MPSLTPRLRESLDPPIAEFNSLKVERRHLLSLSSLQSSDPLVADYIDYLLALPDTPQPVKSQLMGLSSDPAFKRAGGNDPRIACFLDRCREQGWLLKNSLFSKKAEIWVIENV